LLHQSDAWWVPALTTTHPASAPTACNVFGSLLPLVYTFWSSLLVGGTTNRFGLRAATDYGMPVLCLRDLVPVWFWTTYRSCGCLVWARHGRLLNTRCADRASFFLLPDNGAPRICGFYALWVLLRNHHAAAGSWLYAVLLPALHSDSCSDRPCCWTACLAWFYRAGFVALFAAAASAHLPPSTTFGMILFVANALWTDAFWV
jgi:hypothetical protein